MTAEKALEDYISTCVAEILRRFDNRHRQAPLARAATEYIGTEVWTRINPTENNTLEVQSLDTDLLAAISTELKRQEISHYFVNQRLIRLVHLQVVR